MTTSDKLIEATIELLDKGGESEVRVNVVAEMADVTAPSIYHFFRDRDGLIIAAQAERYRRTLFFGIAEQANSVRDLKTHAEFVRFIEEWMRGIGSQDGKRRRRIRAEVLGSAISRPGLRTLLADADREAAYAIARVIETAQDRGWTGARFDPYIGAIWWYGMVNGRVLVEDTFSSDEIARWDEIAVAAVLRLFGER